MSYIAIIISTMMSLLKKYSAIIIVLIACGLLASASAPWAGFDAVFLAFCYSFCLFTSLLIIIAPENERFSLVGIYYWTYSAFSVIFLWVGIKDRVSVRAALSLTTAYLLSQIIILLRERFHNWLIAKQGS